MRNEILMQNVTVRLREDSIDRLDDEADERGVSRSEYIRDILDERHRVEELEAEVDRLQDRLDAREDRIAELEDQLRRRSDVEEKIEALPDKIRETESYQERRQRALDRASVVQRLRWKVTGVPVDEVERDDASDET
jgi:chromosome segregation ATPase